MATLTRVAYTVAYVAVALGLGVFVLAAWWLFAAYLGQFGCDGLGGPCGSVGKFTRDYWWLITFVAAAVVGVGLLPLYQRLISFYSE